MAKNDKREIEIINGDLPRAHAWARVVVIELNLKFKMARQFARHRIYRQQLVNMIHLYPPCTLMAIM